MCCSLPGTQSHLLVPNIAAGHSFSPGQDSPHFDHSCQVQDLFISIFHPCVWFAEGFVHIDLSSICLVFRRTSSVALSYNALPSNVTKLVWSPLVWYRMSNDDDKRWWQHKKQQYIFLHTSSAVLYTSAGDTAKFWLQARRLCFDQRAISQVLMKKVKVQVSLHK